MPRFLLNSYIKFTPRGAKVEVGAKLYSHNQVEIWVADNGPGIPDDLHLKIFDRFEQVKDEQHAAKKGTGLGLALVKSLVELHKGSVSIESSGLMDTGSRFIVRLPF